VQHVLQAQQTPQRLLVLQHILTRSLTRNVLTQVVESWIQSLDCFEHRPILTALFAKYIETTADHCRRNFRTVVPLPLVNQVQTVCKVMEGFLPQARALNSSCVRQRGLRAYHTRLARFRAHCTMLALSSPHHSIHLLSCFTDLWHI